MPFRHSCTLHPSLRVLRSQLRLPLSIVFSVISFASPFPPSYCSMSRFILCLILLSCSLSTASAFQSYLYNDSSCSTLIGNGDYQLILPGATIDSSCTAFTPSQPQGWYTLTCDSTGYRYRQFAGSSSCSGSATVEMAFSGPVNTCSAGQSSVTTFGSSAVLTTQYSMWSCTDDVVITGKQQERLVDWLGLYTPDGSCDPAQCCCATGTQTVSLSSPYTINLFGNLTGVGDLCYGMGYLGVQPNGDSYGGQQGNFSVDYNTSTITFTKPNAACSYHATKTAANDASHLVDWLGEWTFLPFCDTTTCCCPLGNLSSTAADAHTVNASVSTLQGQCGSAGSVSIAFQPSGDSYNGPVAASVLGVYEYDPVLLRVFNSPSTGSVNITLYDTLYPSCSWAASRSIVALDSSSTGASPSSTAPISSKIPSSPSSSSSTPPFSSAQASSSSSLRTSQTSASTSITQASHASSSLAALSSSSSTSVAAPSLSITFYVSINSSIGSDFASELAADIAVNLASFYAGVNTSQLLPFIIIVTVNGSAVHGGGSRRLLSQDVTVNWILLGTVSQVASSSGQNGITAAGAVSQFQHAAQTGTLVAPFTGATIPPQTAVSQTVAASSSSTGVEGSSNGAQHMMPHAIFTTVGVCVVAWVALW